MMTTTIEIIQKLLKENISIDVIVNVSGLIKEEIEKIANNHISDI